MNSQELSIKTFTGNTSELHGILHRVYVSPPEMIRDSCMIQREWIGIEGQWRGEGELTDMYLYET